jgi:hypothetical protein
VILDEWEIPYNKVFRSLTDTGSKIAKAFKILASKQYEDTLVSDIEELTYAITIFVQMTI